MVLAGRWMGASGDSERRKAPHAPHLTAKGRAEHVYSVTTRRERRKWQLTAPLVYSSRNSATLLGQPSGSYFLRISSSHSALQFDGYITLYLPSTRYATV